MLRRATRARRGWRALHTGRRRGSVELERAVGVGARRVWRGTRRRDSHASRADRGSAQSARNGRRPGARNGERRPRDVHVGSLRGQPAAHRRRVNHARARGKARGVRRARARVWRRRPWRGPRLPAAELELGVRLVIVAARRLVRTDRRAPPACLHRTEAPAQAAVRRRGRERAAGGLGHALVPQPARASRKTAV